ncbi:S8 family serine peptidase [Streptacidiphilus sp. N1-10]|uniref:S8 family serine peptidase n=1 Tax=Streptacidiphilus jeojiensis TaxID=3229225 RepID=A0ABV6XUS9_9ACTN
MRAVSEEWGAGRGAGRTAGLARCAAVLALAGVLLGGAVPYDSAGTRLSLSYLVVGRQSGPGALPALERAVRDGGGRVVAEYPQIGTVLAYAGDSDFAARVRREPGVLVAGASRTAPFADSGAGSSGSSGSVATGASGPGPSAQDSLHQDSLHQDSQHQDAVHQDDTPPAPDPHGQPQWNQRMMAGGPLPSAAALRGTVVAVLDSGVDDTHPDLRQAVDPSASASCATGSPDSAPGAWRPDPQVGESGHGTHVSGIIAADRPGDGVAGVAPGVRIAAVRLLGPAGQYYGENMVCGFLWAADHGARVINDSYFSDPWKYNCPEDPDQAAITAAVGRAVAYAQRRGAVVVASAGNDAQDLGAPRTDDRSPNDRADGAPQPDRHLGAECIRLPGGLPGVVDVTAVDADGSLAGYSNWGEGRVQLAAPGGDPDGGPDQSVVSDWPGGGYAALAGTSMAAAHVSAAAAVEAARHPGDSSAELVRLLEQAALPVQCPSGNVGGSGCPGAAYYGYGLVELPTR